MKTIIILLILLTLPFKIFAKIESIDEVTLLQTIEKNNSDIEKIIKNQNKILENQNNDKINIKKEIGLPVFLSVIAGIIFWIIFQVIPTINRRKQLRPKIDKDLMNISSTMIHMVQLSLLHNENPVSFFNKELSNGTLTKEAINIGLYNKSLNNDHLVGVFSRNIVIGEEIYIHTKKIEERIERILYFNEQLSINEIMILEEIYQNIKKYDLSDFNRKYETTISGITYTAADPTLSHLSDFFFKIYQLRERLDRVIALSNNNDISIFYKKISFLKQDKKFKTAIQLIQKRLKRASNDDESLKWNLFDLYYLYDKKQALSILNQLVNQNTSLVSYRGYLRDYIEDENVLRILENNSSRDKVQYLLSTIKNEDQAKAHLLELNTMLKASIKT
ncbi:MAG: hypothetical protein LBQ29_13765 [Acinetobacter sp.]|jgi:hypothetical protein|uniref:hypothetical protein n=1 Tax=Acinetobacter sp. TaxID=472 RepID=UPI0028175B0F|nr:hypothetical protein [Acinetobacter sp.]MDR2062457.1 hypothetical protein [Acinetobacter sp.]